MNIREPEPGSNDRIYVWKQHTASFLANVPAISMGITLAWSAPAVPVLLGQVADDPQPLRLSLEQASWVVAMMPLASLAGALVAGPLAERVGRKGALLLGAAPTLLGWILMAFAGTSLALLVTGRLLTGLASGAVNGPVALYCEEIADVRRRGALGSYQHLVSCFGCLIIYALGAWLPYFWMTLAPSCLPVVFVLTFWWMPESPAYLAMRGRRERAQEALAWFRGPDLDFEVEIEALLVSKTQNKEFDDRTKSFYYLCTQGPLQSNALRSLGIVLLLMFFQQMTGMGLLTFYTVKLFQDVNVPISSYTCTLIIGVANLIAVLIAASTVDRFGRRILLLISSISMGICLLVLSIHSYLENSDWISERFNWVPVICLVLYGVMFSAGMGPLPWFLMAELLPMYAKGWASPAAVCMNRISMFLVVKESPLMIEYVGKVPTFLMFGSICFLAAIFITFCVPETKGKIKADILKEIGGKRP